MTVWIIERGYYEERSVEAVCSSREAVDRKAQELHPSEDHFFGMDPTCYQWQPESEEDTPKYLRCKGCTMAAYPSDVRK